MGEFLSFVIEFALWLVFWHIVFKIVGVWLDNKVGKPLEKERDEVIKKVMHMIHTVKQEQHGDCYYWFDSDTDEFLAQGTNDAEIKEHLKQRFKGHAFILDDTRAWAGPELKIVSISELKLNKDHTIA